MANRSKVPKSSAKDVTMAVTAGCLPCPSTDRRRYRVRRVWEVMEPLLADELPPPRKEPWYEPGPARPLPAMMSMARRWKRTDPPPSVMSSPPSRAEAAEARPPSLTSRPDTRMPFSFPLRALPPSASSFAVGCCSGLPTPGFPCGGGYVAGAWLCLGSPMNVEPVGEALGTSGR